MPEQFVRLQNLISNRVDLLNIPMIRLEKAIMDSSTKKIIDSAESYNWVLFTSMKAVRFFFDAYNKKTETLNKVKFAAIGKSTQNELKKYNIKTTYLNEGNTSIDFTRNLINKKIILSTDKVLFPTGNKTGNKIKDKLERYCNFTQIITYNNIEIEEINQEYLKIIKENKYDLILFTSPSAFSNFVSITKNKITKANLKIASIGDITDNTVRSLSYKSELVASKPNLEVVVKDILEYLKLRIEN